MADTLSALLAKTPDAMQDALGDLLESTRRTRKAYGYDTAPDAIPEPLTLEEMKSGELRNAQTITDQVIREHGGKSDLVEDDWSGLWMAGPLVVHDRDLPRFVLCTIQARCWTYEGARAVLERAWTLPEWPGQYGRELWLMAFAYTDFICTERQEGNDCPLHFDEWDSQGDDEPITLYRGSLKSTRRGMSWTTDLERAQWFARRGDMSGKGREMHVWRCEVPREHTLAHFNHRSEHEVVADVRGLKITKEAS